MSTIKVTNIKNASTDDGGIAIDGTGHVQVDGLQLPTAGALSSRNKIINGDMRIDQRNAGSSVAVPNGAVTYLLDRWNVYENTAGAVSVQRSTTAPTGFTNSALITVTTADSSIGASDIGTFRQYIEGFNIADLGWGTSSAKTVTLSFWVRSSLTGDLGGSIQNYAGNRSYPFTYTINTADTWEQKTVTISGDTSGTWNTDSSGGIGLFFSLCAGSTYLGTADTWAGANYWGATGQVQPISTLNATLYITGVQLEVGEKATPFEHRSYGDELARCQRYYFLLAESNNKQFAVGTYYTSGQFAATVHFPVSMRAVPTLDYETGTDYYRIWSTGTFDDFAAFSAVRANLTSAGIDTSTGTGGTQGNGGVMTTLTTTAYVGWSAEL